MSLSINSKRKEYTLQRPLLIETEKVKMKKQFWVNKMLLNSRHVILAIIHDDYLKCNNKCAQ